VTPTQAHTTGGRRNPLPNQPPLHSRGSRDSHAYTGEGPTRLTSHAELTPQHVHYRVEVEKLVKELLDHDVIEESECSLVYVYILYAIGVCEKEVWQSETDNRLSRIEQEDSQTCSVSAADG
jgi:hypothetical protein